MAQRTGYMIKVGMHEEHLSQQQLRLMLRASSKWLEEAKQKDGLLESQKGLVQIIANLRTLAPELK